MTDNAKNVFNWMKNHYGEEHTKQEIADALGISISAVTGSMRGLENKGLAVMTRDETVEVEPATDTRKAKTKSLKYHTLTEAALSYDPEVAEAEEKARKEAEKAAKKAAKENA